MGQDHTCVNATTTDTTQTLMTKIPYSQKTERELSSEASKLDRSILLNDLRREGECTFI